MKFLAAALLLPTLASAQNLPTIPGVKTTTPPKLDGVLSPGEWPDSGRVTNFTVIGQTVAAKDQTIAYLAYDSKFIYVAFDCTVGTGKSIIAREIERGVSLEADDSVLVLFNPFNNSSDSSISQFESNAIGTQTEEIAGGRASKTEWRGLWDVATKKSDHGYIVEMRIPWHVLPLPSAGTRDIQIDFARRHQHEHQGSWWADLTQNNRFELMGVWKGIEIPDAKPQALQGLGYIAPRWDIDNSDDSEFKAGLDLRFRPNGQNTSLVSINPDFLNIEQQVEQIGFTRSERFLGDARPFFQEGESHFQLNGMHGIGRMFYSRRIGSFDWGFKSFGQVGDRLGYGVLVAHDGRNRSDSVANIDYVIDNRSDINFYTTGRQDRGHEDRAFGFNADLGRGNWGVGGEYIMDTKDNRHSRAFGTTAFFQDSHVLVYFDHHEVEPGFRPDLSLVQFDDLKNTYLYTEYSAQYGRGPLRVIGIEAFAERATKFDNTPFFETANINAAFRMRNDISYELTVEQSKFEGLPSKHIGADVTIGASNRFRRYGFGISTGEIDRVPYESYSVFGSFRLAPGLDVSLNHRSISGLQGDTQTVGGIKWTFNQRQSLAGRWVRNGRGTNAYLAYRSAGGTGMEYYIILGDPNAPRSRNLLSFKLVWAF